MAERSLRPFRRSDDIGVYACVNAQLLLAKVAHHSFGGVDDRDWFSWAQSFLGKYLLGLVVMIVFTILIELRRTY